MLGAGTAEKEADFNPIGALHAKMAGVVTSFRPTSTLGHLCICFQYSPINFLSEHSLLLFFQSRMSS
jgi:hypothetical protein